MAAPVAQRIDGAGADEDALENLGQHIVLDIAFGAAERVNADVDDIAAAGAGRARRFIGDGQRPDARAHRRLTPLLRTLITHPELAESEIAIEAPGTVAKPAREFFVRFDQVAVQHIGHTHGIWGQVGNARVIRDDLYLNCGGKDLPSILVPEAIKTVLYQRHRVELGRDFNNAQMLVLGRPFRAMSGKTLCVLESADHIALIRDE